jgi:hypothetical protein
MNSSGKSGKHNVFMYNSSNENDKSVKNNLICHLKGPYQGTKSKIFFLISILFRMCIYFQ